MNRKIEAGRRLAARLFPAENTIDEALVASATLQIALVTARKDAREPCGRIQSALERAAAANQALVEARREAVHVHEEIVKMRDDLGLPTTGYGCEVACLMVQEPASKLQAV
jgi:hydrogenase maturation factor